MPKDGDSCEQHILKFKEEGSSDDIAQNAKDGDSCERHTFRWKEEGSPDDIAQNSEHGDSCERHTFQPEQNSGICIERGPLFVIRPEASASIGKDSLKLWISIKYNAQN